MYFIGVDELNSLAADLTAMIKDRNWIPEVFANEEIIAAEVEKVLEANPKMLKTATKQRNKKKVEMATDRLFAALMEENRDKLDRRRAK